MKQLLITCLVFLVTNSVMAEPCEYRQVISAIQRGDMEQVKELNRRGCPFTPTSPSSVSALEIALLLGHNDIFAALLAMDNQLVETSGANALVAACDQRQQNKWAIEKLLAQGVNIDALSSHHYNCLYQAAVQPDIDFFRYLLTLGANPERLIVPAPEYQLEKRISVRQFITMRLTDFQNLSHLLTEPEATQKHQVK